MRNRACAGVRGRAGGDAGAGTGATAAPEHAVPAATTHRPSGTTSVIAINAVFRAYSLVSTCMIQAEIEPRLNGLLLNWYDGGVGHYIGKHRDSDVNRVEGTAIVTLSFGEARVFRVRRWRGQGFLDVPQLLPEILAGLGDDFRRDAIDRSKRVGPVPPHHIQAGRVEFGDDEEAPFEPCGVFALCLRDKCFVRRGVGAREISDDSSAFADAEIAVLQQRHFLPWI